MCSIRYYRATKPTAYGIMRKWARLQFSRDTPKWECNDSVMKHILHVTIDFSQGFSIVVGVLKLKGECFRFGEK